MNQEPNTTSTQTSPVPLLDALAVETAARAETDQKTNGRAVRPLAPVDHSLYHVPGFCSALTDYTLAAAPVPNLPAAFAGSLAMLSYLAGRRFIGANSAFPNLYLILLGESGCGKDKPREVNASLALQLGIEDGVIDGFASGAGLIDALRANPLLLSQYDEVKELFASLVARGSDSGISEQKSSALLRAFSSAGSHLSRALVSANSNKVDKLPRTVRAPHLTLFGTGTPEEVYHYITPEMLGDGLAGRMLFIEADRFAGSNLAAEVRKQFPKSLLDHARKLLEGKPSPVDTRDSFDTMHDFKIVPYSADGFDAWTNFRKDSDARRIETGKLTDALARSRNGAFAREVELAGKCALLYALSEDAEHPAISAAGIRWASRFVREHQSFIFTKIADNFGATPEGKAASKILAKIRDCGGEASLTKLGQTFRWAIRKKDFDAALGWLVENGEIEETTIATKTKPRTIYRLAECGGTDR